MALISFLNSKSSSKNPSSKFSLKKLSKSSVADGKSKPYDEVNEVTEQYDSRSSSSKTYGDLNKPLPQPRISPSPNSLNSQNSSSSLSKLDLAPPPRNLSTSTTSSHLLVNHADEIKSDSTIDRRSFSENFSTNSAPSSPRRVLTDKMKATPSSLHRQTRIYSSNFDAASLNPSVNSESGSRSTILQNKLNNENLPAQLSPIISLLNCQKLRTYMIGTFQVPGSFDGEKIWIEVEAKLTGNELAIWRPSDEEITVETGYDEFKPKYINLVDSKFEIIANSKDDYEIKFSIDYQEDNNIVVRFHSAQDMVKWVAAIQLANFEYTSLNEAYTAVLLSLKGSKLSDIHILLAPKQRFIKKEWINLRLPQISNKWLKLYMLIIPGDSKHLGRIEIYKNDKVHKKNIVVYIPKLSNVYNVFPEHTNMIDFNAIMKLNGEVYVNKQYHYLFQLAANDDIIPPYPPSHTFSLKKSDSFHSLTNFIHLSSPSPGPSSPHHEHSRNHSGNFQSTASFFNNAPSPKESSFNKEITSPIAKPAKIGGRIRSFSQGSKSSDETIPRSHSSSFISKNFDQFVTTDYIYIMPATHPGVPVIETMIRNLIPCIDAFKLYGRPQHLISDKTNPQSFLFGLPSLPHYEYLSNGEANELVSTNLKLSISENWTQSDWRLMFVTYLAPKMRSGFKGHGNIGELYSNLDYTIYQGVSSPRIQFNRESSSESELSDGTASPFVDSDSALYFNNHGAGNLKDSSDQLLGAPIDFKRQYNSSPLSNSFSVKNGHH